MVRDGGVSFPARSPGTLQAGRPRTQRDDNAVRIAVTSLKPARRPADGKLMTDLERTIAELRAAVGLCDNNPPVSLPGTGDARPSIF
jgi:hypothetical protein